MVNGRVNKTEVVPPGVLGVGWGFYYPDKKLIFIEVQVEMSQLFLPLLAISNFTRD